MASPISIGKLEFNIVSDMNAETPKPAEETPFRMLLLGDFSGRANSSDTPAARISPNANLIRVDRDTIDTLPAKLTSSLRLPLFGKSRPQLALNFAELDDFHPDAIYDRLEIFQILRAMRKKAGDPRSFAQAARDLYEVTGMALPGSESEEKKIETPSQAAPTTEGQGEGLLDAIIGSTPLPPTPATGERDQNSWDTFLQSIVTPHLVAEKDSDQIVLEDAIDEAAGHLMRQIVHHPDFQALEAAWRGLALLVSRLETDDALQLLILDISKEELAADLCSDDDLQRTSLYNLLRNACDESQGGKPWSLLLGDFSFAATVADAELLGRSGTIAACFKAPFIGSADSSLLGCSSLADAPDPDDWRDSPSPESFEAWEFLRKQPAARYMGLALPRFLSRLPYGQDTDPIDRFPFEEFSNPPRHAEYLWAPAAFACGLLVGTDFNHRGWAMHLGENRRIDGLPVYVYEEGGETVTKPCAEILMSERAVEEILERGIMAFISYKDQDHIMLARFQSLALPLAPLRGRWEATG